MSALPNPLQELADKAGDHFSHFVNKKAMVDFLLPLLTESLGTLLQAERAATIKLAAEAQCEYCESQIPGKPGHGHWSPVGGEDMNIHKSIAGAKWDYYCDARHILPLATPEAASALSAVVQRETEKAQKEMASNAYQVLGAIFGATCNPIPRVMEWFYSAAQGRVSPDLFPLTPEECSVFKQSLDFKKLADLK